MNNEKLDWASLGIALVFALAGSAANALAQPGWVLSHEKISDIGRSTAALGDLDGDGVGDMAIGDIYDDDGGPNRGAVWVLFLNPDGTVKSSQKISDTEGGFTGTLDDVDHFGTSVASLGDFDGDDVTDIAVGAFGDDGGGLDLRGAVWILLLNADGTVKAHHKIGDTEGGFTGHLDDEDEFGSSVASLGDFDGDGVRDLAVGARRDDDGGHNHGAVWILLLNADGTVKSHQKISDTQGGFFGDLDDIDRFAGSLACLGDLDGDGVSDLAVGADGDDDGGGGGPGHGAGAVWILFLEADGTVKSHQKISDTEGDFTGGLEQGERLGWSVSSLGDIDGDGVGDLAAGARNGASFPGAVWILFLKTNGTVRSHQRISDAEGGFTGSLDAGDRFGSAVAALGDLDGDGKGDLAVGASGDDDGPAGAVWILFVDGVADCPADLDGSGDVGFTDLLAVLSNWGPCPKCSADLDGSGDVGFTDLLAVIAIWGPCQSHPGACCFPDGACVIAAHLGGADCFEADGVYQGDDTVCEGASCPGTGACCFDGSSCAVQSGTQCLADGGTFVGEGTICGSTDCTRGACCLPDGTCFAINPATCDVLAGIYQGDGTTCETASCP